MPCPLKRVLLVCTSQETGRYKAFCYNDDTSCIEVAEGYSPAEAAYQFMKTYCQDIVAFIEDPSPGR